MKFIEIILVIICSSESIYMTAECDCFVSSLEFSVAQWLDYLARVWKAVGSFPIWNLDSFSEFFSPHVFFYLFISSSEY